MGLDGFFSPGYQIHNSARLNHLATLGLPLDQRRVLEVGSGPGDHTGFYVARGCEIVSTDGRQECVDKVRERYPTVIARLVDMDFPVALTSHGMFDVVHAYGILYHLQRPADAISAMAAACSDLLLLETCVSHTKTDAINLTPESRVDPTQAVSGVGCRPDRHWLFQEMKKSFEFVYQTRTQPLHPEFPIEWSAPPLAALSRVVFVGSRKQLNEEMFSPCVLDSQNYGD